MGYDCGTAAGLLAGAFTESTVIGTAGNTISRLALPEAEKTRLLNNIPVAYAVSYLVGTSFVVWFLSSLAPRLLRVDLKEESRKLEAQAARARRPRPGRARPTASGTCGRSASRTRWAGRTRRRTSRLLRAGPRLPRARCAAAAGILDGRRRTPSSRPATWRSSAARRHVLLGRGAPFGEEVEDRELLDFPMAALDVVVTRREVAERPLAEIAEEHGRGVVLLKLVRARRGDPLRAGHGRQPRRPAPARRAPSATSSGRGRRSATSSGRRARRTWSSWASGSCSAASSAR